MPPRTDALGLGGQSVGDFLALSDTPTLREKYYNTLQGGLDTATEPAQPDQSAMLWQGIVPALAMALLTKGKSAQFSGAPMLNVLSNEQKRADDQQKLTVEAKLKGAGLFGEELGRRESLATATANKEEDRQSREDMAKQASQDRLAIAAQSSADRRFLGEMSNRDRDENRKFQQDIQGEKLSEQEKKALTDDFNTEMKNRGLDQQAEGIQTAKAILSKGTLTVTDMQGLKEAVTRALVRSRPANATMENLLPSDVATEAKKLMNYIESGAENPFSDAKTEAIQGLVKALEAENAMQIGKIHDRILNSTKGAYLKKTGQYDAVMSSLGSSYKGSEGGGSKSYTNTSNGASVSEEQLLTKYTPAQIQQMVQTGALK